MARTETVDLGLEPRHSAPCYASAEPSSGHEDEALLPLGPTQSPGTFPGGFHESGSLVPTSPGHTGFEGYNGLKQDKTYYFSFVSPEALNGSEDTHNDVTAVQLFPPF